jgi:excisionase family DNA binding protein
MSHIDSSLRSGALAEGILGPRSSDSSDSSNSYFVNAKAPSAASGGAKLGRKGREHSEVGQSGVEADERTAACTVPALEPAEIMTLQETSELLRISRPTLLDLVKREALPCRRVGRAWRFRRSAVLEWLEGGGGTARSRRRA